MVYFYTMRTESFYSTHIRQELSMKKYLFPFLCILLTVPSQATDLSSSNVLENPIDRTLSELHMRNIVAQYFFSNDRVLLFHPLDGGYSHFHFPTPRGKQWYAWRYHQMPPRTITRAPTALHQTPPPSKKHPFSPVIARRFHD
jgi:hypothetical protein